MSTRLAPASDRLANPVEGTAAERAEATAVEKATFVVVRVEGESYCLPVEQVKEIVSDVKTTAVPGSPELIRGVVNVRGRVFALGDLSRALGGEGVSVPSAPILVLDSVVGEELAIVVEEVTDVLDLSGDRLEPPPAYGLGGATPFADAVADLPQGLAVVLDLSAIFAKASGVESFAAEDGKETGGDR